jgi:ABC-type nitrate/sulfonate/bicarbonate transport system substrate-binding protein
MKRLLAFTLGLLTCVASSCAKPQQVFKIAKCTHAIGLCNLAIFIAKEDQTSAPYGVNIQLIDIPNWGDHPAALASGTVDFSVTPFTNVLTAFANGLPIKIIAGSGINGLYLLGSKDVHTAADLRGKRIGTFRADTLELMLYGYLKQQGMSYDDVHIEYFTDGSELLQAFAAHRLDAITHVEPFATKVVRELGANRLTTGQAVWGGDHPDCVLTASDRIIQGDPALVKALIAGMMTAEGSIEGNLDLAISKVVGTYYKTDAATLKSAAHSQPPGVDIRDKTQFINARFQDLKDLHYITKIPVASVVDFRFLNEVVKEHPELYRPLLVKADLR